ncbi:Hypothetical predicted protein [Podarcis lilfordi]|uniref:Uncharacterized protein n=2 Tax=Podarcis lilfordi TaxID=74358 RepID=A0AA35LBY0_9SAUR|nr:Hypothetical predicted protein [Podarcis lilfordi]
MAGLALLASRRSSRNLPWAAAAGGLRGYAGGGDATMPKKGKTQSKDIAKSSVPSGPVATDKSGSVTISVHAKPGSKQNAVTDVTTDAVGVAIAAPPSEGEANAELCRYLSKVLEVKKSEVVLEKGGKSREKVVKILAPVTPNEVLEKLRKEAAS